jgi:hypothetical protein
MAGLLLVMGPGPGGDIARVRAEAGQPKLECNSSVDWQLVWPASGEHAVTVEFPFEGVAGQVVSFQLALHGPLWHDDHVGAQLSGPSGATLLPDPFGAYQLTSSGTYSIVIYGVPAYVSYEDVVVPQHTAMPFTLSLRCTSST